MKKMFEVKMLVDFPEDHPMMADPSVYENGSAAQETLKKALHQGSIGFVTRMNISKLDIEYVVVKRILEQDEIHVLALDLYSDGPVRMPEGADEEDTLTRLETWHPRVHAVERTDKGAVLIHR